MSVCLSAGLVTGFWGPVTSKASGPPLRARVTAFVVIATGTLNHIHRLTLYLFSSSKGVIQYLFMTGKL